MSEHLKEGTLWRRSGPLYWQRVEAVLLPGFSKYDGGAPGVAVVEYEGRKATGRRRRWFVIARDAEDFERRQRGQGLYPSEGATP